MQTALSTKIILFAYNHSRVYPPQADSSTALKELHWILCKLETTYPEAAFIVAGDFNKANLKRRPPKFYQHIECATRAGKILDHCYSNFCDTYKALPCPPFGQIWPRLHFVAPILLTETRTGNAQVCSTLVRPIWFHASRLLRSRGLGYVPHFVKQQHWRIRWFSVWVY